MTLPTPTDRGFFAASTTDAARLLAAGSAVVLIGGFDGSANFGDVLQARVALQRVADAHPISTIAIVLEEEYAEYTLAALAPPTGTIILRFSDTASPRTLTQLPALTLAYLYGGGYLNESWSARRLRHFHTMVGLVGHGGSDASPRVAATGLQVTPHDSLWAWMPWLAAASPLGVRDAASADTLKAAGLDPEPITNSADDAVTALLSYGPRSDDDQRCINVHLSTGDYATDNPEQRHAWLTATLDELSRAVPGLRCNLIVAFDDPRVSEHELSVTIEGNYLEHVRLGGSPVDFTTISLIDALETDARAELGGLGTITSSYHVGLASLLAGIPTVLLAENDFYRQKMSSLAELFGLPDNAVICPATADSADVASILDVVREALAGSHSGAVALMQARSAAAASAVAHVVCRLDRDLLWADAQAVFAHYRMLSSEVADLKERKRYLELHNREMVQQIDAAVRHNGPAAHVLETPERRTLRRNRPS